MSLEERINAEIKTAMLAKDSVRLESLRAIKSAILLLKTSPEGLTAESETKALQKMVKQRRETADIYVSQNRQDLADAEISQANIIEEFLPKALSEAEILAELELVISETGASSAADFGKVMGLASKRLAGKADGKQVSELLKKRLSGN
jgi:uncharacterized protein